MNIYNKNDFLSDEIDIEEITRTLIDEDFSMVYSVNSIDEKINYKDFVDNMIDSNDNPYRKIISSGKNRSVFQKNKQKMTRNIAQELMYTQTVWVLYDQLINFPACTDDDTNGFFISLDKETLETYFSSVIDDQFVIKEIVNTKDFFLENFNENGFETVHLIHNIFLELIIDKSFFSAGENRKVEFMLAKDSQLDDEVNSRRLKTVLDASDLFVPVLKSDSDNEEDETEALNLALIGIPNEDDPEHPTLLVPAFTTIPKLFDLYPKDEFIFLETAVKDLKKEAGNNNMDIIVNPKTVEYVIKTH